MEIFFDYEALKEINEPVGVTIGTFDGLHLGHQTVIKHLKKRCEEKGLKSVVYTFSNNPREVTTGEEVSKIINLEEKVELITSLGVDYLVLIEFTEDHMNLPPIDFLRQVFFDHLQVKDFVIGHDFRFGKRAEGDFDLIESLKDRYGYEVDMVEPVIMEGERISSTQIRSLLSAGKVEAAAKVLGRWHYYRSTVIEGKRVGRKLGFPTANLHIDAVMHTLKPGVYVTETLVGGKRFPSVTNIGYNPTFTVKGLNLETHILGFEKDIYGQEIVVFFLKRIRDELVFSSVEDLRSKIDEDVAFTKEFFRS